MKKHQGTTDQDIEQQIGNLLRLGVLLSMAVVIIGGAIYLYRHGHDVSDYAHFKFNNQPDFTRQLVPMFNGILALRGRAIIQAGIILLIATPVARVLLSAIGFILEKDYLYVVIACIVLTIIIVSMLGGFGG